ncbi:conserved hypothetical protein [Thiomonas arsenitoxydans]|uniref:Uncharacterized protein n=1 Tax=Thiomonas arsenitoxydans (strain DSM 22701 / CIP 110005 / 3As) TaxID=426114 RepID=D6CSA6_THIA3|nr:hypothetical protein [Thiomonas arsenitoxydans]CAZ87634.1 Hypothetical protein THI_0932 [Thiomonas arsenitoxydans]CQR26932.1 conserved hypothetical protein [Thiomonas arsenitoxydans]CQR30251.1 conserved hypothetical protein [Thiomonas arsenitoxydans]CQR30303.1 conserved hypothetical protein [Thiomonas arsenitoxydans]
MSGLTECDQDSPGVAETIRAMSADEVRKLLEEARASELRRTLEDVQAVVAAWHEFGSHPTPSKATG